MEKNSDGHLYSLFIITIPGLEELAHNELKEKLSLLNITEYQSVIDTGGIHFSSNEATHINILHSYLKIPTKILLRLTTFRAKDFPKLYKNLRKITWRELIPWVTPELVFGAHQSKIFDDRKVKKCLLDAIKDENIANIPKEKYKTLNWQETPEVYIRAVNDDFTVSINLTGERLDRRGKKLFTTKAPIRESIASAMFFTLKSNLETAQDLTLLDPMAGSGTLLFEASHFFKKNERAFNYEQMPFLKERIANFKVPDLVSNTYEFLKYMANDMDSKAIETIHKNKDSYNLDHLEILNSDYQELNLISPESAVVICNPPYNRRIKTEVAMDEFLDNFLSFFFKKKVKALVFITPIENISKKYKGYKLAEYPNILNGGIKTKICCYHFCG